MDELPGVRRPYTRREALLTGLSAFGFLLLSPFMGGCAPKRRATDKPLGTTTSITAAGGRVCVLAAEQEEGPFFIDEGLLRQDITEGQAGVPLALTIVVVNATTCKPLQHAAVDIWSASPGGHYSDLSGEGTANQKFLRGIQVTDAQGMVTFKTVYPGWYADRTCHIHLKVRTGGRPKGKTFDSAGSHEAHRGQFFFPELLNEQLRTVYKQNQSSFINNAEDGIFTEENGAEMLLALQGSMASGYTARATVGVKA